LLALKPVVDNIPPTAAITYSVPSPYKSGTVVTITATFSEAMADSPATKIAISGANTLSATNMTKSSSTVYTYAYTIGAGDGTATVALSVGTDLAGNVVTAAPTSGATFTVDNTAPTNQDTVFATSVIKKGGASVAIVSSGDATNNVWFAPLGTTTFTAGATMTVAGGTATTILAPATAGTYYCYLIDAAGNISSHSTATLTVDTTAPTAAITYSVAGPYKSGTVVTITATFSKAMADSPVPQIAISGANILAATSMTKSSSTVYTYAYTIGAGNGTATVALSTGTDIAGNVITSAPTSGATFTVDNTAPTAAITYSPAGGVYKSGTVVTITATFSEAMADSPVPQIVISGANTLVATNMTKSSSTVYTYAYTIGAGNGTATVSLGTGTDMAGNVVTSTPTSGLLSP